MMATFEERAREAALQKIGHDNIARNPYGQGFVDGARWGAADRERELRQPSPCGHPKACEITEQLNPGFDVTYCSACRREQARESKLRKALENAPRPELTEFDLDDYMEWYLSVRAEVLKGGGK